MDPEAPIKSTLRQPGDRPWHRTVFPYEGGVRLEVPHYDVRTEAGAREALARVNVVGGRGEKAAVQAAVARHWPRIGKPAKTGSVVDHFPNSNMKP